MRSPLLFPSRQPWRVWPLAVVLLLCAACNINPIPTPGSGSASDETDTGPRAVDAHSGGGDTVTPPADVAPQTPDTAGPGDDVPAPEDVPFVEDVPVIEDVPFVEDVPADVPVGEDVVEDVPAPDDVPFVDDTQTDTSDTSDAGGGCDGCVAPTCDLPASRQTGCRTGSDCSDGDPCTLDSCLTFLTPTRCDCVEVEACRCDPDAADGGHGACDDGDQFTLDCCCPGPDAPTVPGCGECQQRGVCVHPMGRGR